MFRTQSLISGENLRPDLILFNRRKTILYILELTVGFESSLEVNSIRKSAKYLSLLKALRATYREVKFVNVSMSALGALDKSCDSLLAMLNNLDNPCN